MKPIITERFWSKVDRNGPVHAVLGTRCWIWTGARTDSGYGNFLIVRGHHTAAHRFAYELEHGLVAPDKFVCHHCDVRECVRPDHLFVGTQLDNIRDMISKGRHFSPQRGVTHCIRGHELAGENLYVLPSGQRQCRTCKRDRRRKRHLTPAASVK